ncbi:MAG: carboxypeptidase regulatory-like domain-containing protein [Bacteroidetes bacterium]|nr:carboxypeptidase regulatory-like domain-containing protein [Bacteroidota bacterium]
MKRNIISSQLLKLVSLSVFILSLLQLDLASAQNVLKKGKLSVTFNKVENPPEFLTPPLDTDENNESAGIIYFSISDKSRKFFKIDDIQNWISNDLLKIDGVTYDKSQVRIEGEKIRVKFRLEYFGREDKLDKRIRIETNDFSYVGTLGFYKLKLAFYTIDIQEEPQYDRDIFGAISVIVPDADGANVSIKDQAGFNQSSTIKGGSAIFEKLNEGIYTVTVTKSGFQTETRQVTVKPGTTATPVSLVLKKQTLVLAIKSNISGFDILIIDDRGQNVYQQFDKSSGLVIDLVPGKYTVKVTKQEYKDDTKSVTLSTSNETVTMYLEKSAKPQPIVKQEKSSNTWVYLLLLGAAGGGAAWYFTQGGGGTTGGGDYGSPPALPTLPLFRR